MSRTCKRCGDIDYGIWGTIGLIGYSLIVGGLGYAFSSVFYFRSIVIIAVVFGIILYLPMAFISYHELKEEKE